MKGEKERGKNSTWRKPQMLFEENHKIPCCLPECISAANRGDLLQRTYRAPWRDNVLNALLKSRNTALKPLHPLSRCEFIACVRRETASRALHLHLYANWYRSIGRVVIEAIVINTGASRTLSGTGLHAIKRICGEAPVDYFLAEHSGPRLCYALLVS